MLEIPGKNPSFNLVVPAEYDLGRNTYRIEGNEMYYFAGLLRRKFNFDNGSISIFSPKNTETDESDDSYIVFQTGFQGKALNEILKEILVINNESRKTIYDLLGNKIHEHGRPWMQILRTPKNDIPNKNRDFNVMHVDSDGFFEASVKEDPESSLIEISANTYEKVHELTRIKIDEVLRNSSLHIKRHTENAFTLH